MEKILYVYSNENIEALKKDFNNSHIISISYILNRAANLEDLESEDFDEYIIDLTILAFENNYYKIFIERYLYKLIDKFKNAKFLVNSLQKDCFF